MQFGHLKFLSQANLVGSQSLLLFNNLILTVMAVSVLLGTLYPLLVDAMVVEKYRSGRILTRFLFR